MNIRIVTLSLALALGAQAAIKKAADPQPEPQSPRPPAKAAEENPLRDWLDNLRKRGNERDGRLELRMGPKELEEMMRDLLGRQGVPQEKLKDADIGKLLELMREQNPNGGGLDLRGLEDLRKLFGPADPKIQKKLDDQFRGLLDGHRPGTAEAARGTFALRDAAKPREQLALAACVNPGGWLLSKASEVTDAKTLECEAGGKWVAARVVRTWKEHDLVLLKAEASDLPVVKWSDKAPPVVGSFVTAVSPEGKDPAAIGVVSVAARSQQEKGRGFLGVQLDADDKGIKIREVIPGGAALKSGVKNGDRVIEVDGNKPTSIFEFTRIISDRKAGEKVNLKLQRGDELLEKEIALGDRASRPGAGAGGSGRSDRMNAMGSTLSHRRADFPSVLQTDFPLNANECGGPVTDLDGNVIGLVIARSGRVDTMVLPSATIREVLGAVDFAKEAETLTSASEKPADSAK